ncbi:MULTISPECIES: c-type cytochrome [unclassified Thioalkalivibrio]|uniref:c-type cytochrome n=1 Tax=unclassified Thioalkalivibrio TaxID=2621013 RepID=UPI000373F077|nr:MULTISPECIES: c-type cytochrome [unclassified Thioalkalivibrio]
MANQPIKMDTGNKVLLFIASVALLATVIYLLIQLANFMGGLQLGEPSEAERDRIAERIQPIGRVASGPVDAEEEAADLSPGDIYSNVCAACHDTGASDAPIKDDSDAWAARLDERSLDEVFDNAISGMGAMPPRGGDDSLSDEEVKLVVAYMLDEAGIDHGWEPEDANGDENGNDEAVAEDDEAAVEDDDALEGIALDDGDVSRGESLYSTCIACHGAQGQGSPAFPKIAGQTAEYIADKLVRYRAGETVGDRTALMAPNASRLSDEDIADLSVFIATFED